ncbi:DDE superfamily endonuclease domain [Phytophthora cactorum]|nr:DDE superfamily endonuclease domain [Phytophthora cactorum]
MLSKILTKPILPSIFTTEKSWVWWRFRSQVCRRGVEGVCYRSGLKGWIDQQIFREYLASRRSRHLTEKKTIFLDNCSGHLSEDECKEELGALNVSLKYFRPTQTCPTGRFVCNAKINDVWRSMWNEKKST